MSFFNKTGRPALWAFLIYMPFAGTITYAIAGGNVLFNFAKDILYIVALIGIIQLWQQQRLFLIEAKPLAAPLGVLLGTCAVTLILANGNQQLAAQTSEQPILMGIIGLKSLIWYIPLILCGYYLIRNKQDLLFLIRLHIILALTCCGLGFMQYLLLATGVCPSTGSYIAKDLFKATVNARCFVGGSLIFNPEVGLIRLPGTFISPWQWGWFLMANSFFTFASAVSDPSRRWRLVSFAALACVFFSGVISGQKIVLLFLPPLLIILLTISSSVNIFKRLILLSAGILTLLTIWTVTPDSVSNLNSFLPNDLIVSQSHQAINEMPGLLGNGLGRATNAARLFGKTQLIESYYRKVIYELGLFGFFGVLGLVSTVSFLTFQAYHSVGDRSLRRLGVCLWVFILFISYNTYYYPLDVDPVAVYYWLFAGVLFKLPKLDEDW
ncbi:MAG TPA: hypothetical protein VK211_18485 [Kamptonema sp.]|nr:hypothetical protein [Kamptonema sp.]